MGNLHEDIALFEKILFHGSHRPLYTVDRPGSLIGKEFTYKGRQVVVIDADQDKRTLAIAPLVRGQPDERHGIIVTKAEFDKAIKPVKEMKEAKYNKKQKCSCTKWPYSCDPDCPRHYLLFAPFYGKGNGKSAAEIHTGGQGASKGTGGGPAFPGAGGINAPGVGGGANTGMGPAMSSTEFTGSSIMEDVKLISQIR